MCLAHVRVQNKTTCNALQGMTLALLRECSCHCQSVISLLWIPDIQDQSSFSDSIMNIDLAVKSLEELNARKQFINNEADLSRECESIREFNDKIVQLADRIKNLHENVERHSSILNTNCEKLSQPNLILSRTSEAFVLTSKIIKLNRLCRRLETSPCLKFIESLGRPNTSENKSSTGTNTSENTINKGIESDDIYKNVTSHDNEDDEDEADEGLVVDRKAAVKIVRDLVVEFEQIYSIELKDILEHRSDLPYAHYRTLVEHVKQYLVDT